MELNREQIIKALECCTKDSCTSCPHLKEAPCRIPLSEKALALINELTEEKEFVAKRLMIIHDADVEIERELTKEVEDLKAIAEQYQKQFEDCYEDKEKLTEDVERLRKQCGEIIVECDERDAERLKQVAELTKENESLKQRMEHEHASFMEIFGQYGEKCDRLTKENERLKSVEFTCGFVKPHKVLECPIFDEVIRTKIDTVRKIQTMFGMRFGTYTDKDMTPITEVFRLLDQIAKEMEEGKV